jgi:hypothetical protein
MAHVTEQDLTPIVLEGGRTVKWFRTIEVDYAVVPEWRAAAEGERCRFGAGGKHATPGCGKPATVTWDRTRSDGAKVRYSFCGEHAGPKVPLADGRVVEPVGVTS